MKKIREQVTVDGLKRADTLLSKVLDDIYDGVYIVDTSRRILSWNKGAEQITGYKQNKVLHRKCSDGLLNHVDKTGRSLCRTACPLLKSIRTGQNIEEKVYPLTKSGNRIPTLTHISPIRDDTGKIVAAIEVFRDITKEEEFRILQDKFRGLIKKYISTATLKTIEKQLLSEETKTSDKIELTVVFIDVVSFTTFCENNPPETVVNMLNSLFVICDAVTKEFNGDIDKFIGDSAMSIFSDPDDAVASAEKIIKLLAELNEKRVKTGGSAINIRIGINSGLVIHGDIGGIERKDLTVIGDVVNTAARIQSTAEINSVYISESTRLGLKNQSKFRFVQKISLKGKKHPVPVYRDINT
jgi:PAS domain S-box-containing protein